MKKGVLVEEQGTNRLSIRYGLDDYSDGLHCGDCMGVKVGGHWKQTRLELGEHGWYLVGVRTDSIIGLQVRVDERW